MTNVMQLTPEFKKKPYPWGTPRAKLEYEIALQRREIQSLVAVVNNLRREREALLDNISTRMKRCGELRAQLAELGAD